MVNSVPVLFRIFILHMLFFLVLGEPILISCNDMCGCITETGVQVNCNFVRGKTFAVLRGDDKYKSFGAFVVHHWISIVPQHVPFEFSPVEENCKQAGGVPPPGGRRICWRTRQRDFSKSSNIQAKIIGGGGRCWGRYS